MHNSFHYSAMKYVGIFLPRRSMTNRSWILLMLTACYIVLLVIVHRHWILPGSVVQDLVLLWNGPPADFQDLKCNACSAMSVSFSIVNGEICERAQMKRFSETIYLLVLVITRIQARSKRDAIRETWGQVQMHHDRRILTLFVVAKSKLQKENKNVQEEQDKHNDLIQVDHVDTYTNLTLKSLMALTWVTKYCSHALYVLKTDDDTFNNLPVTVDFLLAGGLHSNSIGGWCFTIPTNRNINSRFYVSRDVYPYRHLPVFCSGPAYILPRSVLPRLLESSRHISLYPHEDVHVTGIARMLAGVTYRQVPGSCLPSWEVESRSCDLITMVTSVHNVEDMKTLWTVVSDTNFARTCEQSEKSHLALKLLLFISPVVLFLINNQLQKNKNKNNMAYFV